MDNAGAAVHCGAVQDDVVDLKFSSKAGGAVEVFVEVDVEVPVVVEVAVEVEANWLDDVDDEVAVVVDEVDDVEAEGELFEVAKYKEHEQYDKSEVEVFEERFVGMPVDKLEEVAHEDTVHVGAEKCGKIFVQGIVERPATRLAGLTLG